nr:proton-conducting transporter membrane subunit [Micromonospora sp. NBS 11-29]
MAGLTMVVGILGAVAQSDVKRLFSFTLVSHIGYMIFGVALGSLAGLSGAIFYVVHHITVQTTLFLVAGLIEERTGSTDLRRLGGLARIAPVLGVLFFVPAMNLAGIPPFSGFLGKLGLLQAGVAAGGALPAVLVGAGALTSLLTLYVASRVWNIAFWRAPQTTTPPATRLPVLMVGATTALVTIGVLLTLAAGPLFQVTADAATDLRQRTPYVRAVLPREVP